MHLEFLVEDQSGGQMLAILVPKIIGNTHTFNIHSYKGTGHIPKGLKPKTDARKRIFLDQLPKLLRGYGKTFTAYENSTFDAAVVVVCDLDDRCLKEFRRELNEVLNACNPKPITRFCVAIEEGEAWLLGDMPAIESAYPNAKKAVLDEYKNDCVCGTWELLANAIFTGGVGALRAKGHVAIGREKTEWAEKIPPHMDVTTNSSPSFNYFRAKICALITSSAKIDI